MGDFIKDGLTCGLVLGAGELDFNGYRLKGYLIVDANNRKTFIREDDAVLIAKGDK